MEPDDPAPIGHDTTFQIGYVGQKGTHLWFPSTMPSEYCSRRGLPLPFQPVFFSEPNALDVLGNPGPDGVSHGFRHQVERHYGVQLIASRTAEADDPRVASSSCRIPTPSACLTALVITEHGTTP